MTALHIEVNAAQRYQVVTTEDGRRTKPIGPAWPTPKEASRYLSTLAQAPQVLATRSAAHTGDEGTPLSDAPSSESPDPAAPPVDVTGDSLGFGF